MIENIYNLLCLMKTYGAKRLYAKKLAKNDNSKNQIYLGGNFSILNIIPHEDVYKDERPIANSKVHRMKGKLSFSWINENGFYIAPEAQLILYPEYPEVRLSGLLRGCSNAPSSLVRSRQEGRVLFLGVTDDRHVLGYIVDSDHPLVRELNSSNNLHQIGVLLEIYFGHGDNSTKSELIYKLKEIYNKHWISSQKLGANGLISSYKASNGGGYTLEAELGISPNGYSDPDYLGWEIKQYRVNDFNLYTPKSPVTLMTPEPTEGLYRDKGVKEFMRLHGYKDKKGRSDRINFGGKYIHGGGFHKDTGLRMELIGYNQTTGKIVDTEGGIALISRDDETIALWKFNQLMNHWNRKHAQAAYIPSLFKTPPPKYCYGPRILLCETTDFGLFLKAISKGMIYYDPAIKMENVSSEKPVIKRRSQFRIKHNQLTELYHAHSYIDLTSDKNIL